MTGQRTWRRIEAPWTPQGHALTASFGGEVWTAWQNGDGTWSLRYGTLARDVPHAIYPDWGTARATAERLRTSSPRKGNPDNPMAPALIAGAAATGTGFALRHMIAAPNPAAVLTPQGQAVKSEVLASLPRTWVVGVGVGPSGVVTVRVRRGLGSAARGRLHHIARPVRVVEMAAPRLRGGFR